MTNDLSHDWMKTDSPAPEMEEGDSSGVSQKIPIEEAEEPEKRDAPDHLLNPFQPVAASATMASRQHSLPMMMSGIFLGFVVMGTFIFLFFQGVLFLQANTLPGDQASVAISSSPSSSSSAISQQKSISTRTTSTPIITIHVTEEKTPSSSAVWPASLKMNRYTVGSALVPDLSKIIPIPIFSVSKAEANMHAAAGIETSLREANRVPPTGPALWVLLALCLGVTPIFFVRGKGIMSA